MSNIKTKLIIQFLQSRNIHFILNHNVAPEYTVASIFEPIEYGLYFFIGSKLPDNISNSLIITEINSELDITNRNVILYVDYDPQLLFYQLLEHFFGQKSNGKISKTAIIDPKAKIGKNVQIDEYAVIGKATIGDNTIVRSHTYVHDNTFIGSNVVIDNNCIIGASGVAWVWDNESDDRVYPPQLGGVEIKNNVFLGANTIIVRGSINEKSRVGKHTLLAPGCRIGHGTQIGDYVHFANNVITGGNAIIGNYSFIGSSAVFRPRVNIHNNTIVGAGAVVVKNTTKKGLTLIGIPAKENKTKSKPSGMPKPKN